MGLTIEVSFQFWKLEFAHSKDNSMKSKKIIKRLIGSNLGQREPPVLEQSLNNSNNTIGNSNNNKI